ncbi:hypothetical protein SELMODRAFT_418769 [Selaginella moellendorffii]|uniref:Uncharacterized protein n=1 Tax=Selaginella moellendorffii TaxID=88036 RepID=D8S6C1_SELML|nr:hypothetical protein SELMODRAFT_418769 [Selaginella moellendorffii]
MANQFTAMISEGYHCKGHKHLAEQFAQFLGDDALIVKVTKTHFCQSPILSVKPSWGLAMFGHTKHIVEVTCGDNGKTFTLRWGGRREFLGGKDWLYYCDNRGLKVDDYIVLYSPNPDNMHIWAFPSTIASQVVQRPLPLNLLHVTAPSISMETGVVVKEMQTPPMPMIEQVASAECTNFSKIIVANDKMQVKGVMQPRAEFPKLSHLRFLAW